MTAATLRAENGRAPDTNFFEREGRMMQTIWRCQAAVAARGLRGRLGTLALAGAVALALPATAGAVAVTAGAAAAKPTAGCHPAHSTTLAATAKARVFRTRGFSRDTHTHATYGCLESHKRPVRFYVPDFPTGYDHIALAGRFVAYAAYSDCAADFCDPNSVVLQDLVTGKTTFADGAALRVATISGLVLRTDGALAWIQSSFDANGSTQPGLEVAKAEHGQPAVVLDSGTDIAPDSLALAGTTLYWTRGGKPFSAGLG
jgi:hypothetical protein